MEQIAKTTDRTAETRAMQSVPLNEDADLIEDASGTMFLIADTADDAAAETDAAAEETGAAGVGSAGAAEAAGFSGTGAAVLPGSSATFSPQR